MAKLEKLSDDEYARRMYLALTRLLTTTKVGNFKVSRAAATDWRRYLLNRITDIDKRPTPTPEWETYG